MDEEWDAEAKVLPVAPAVGANKWEGEDEDDDVKDNWEDEEEEEKRDVEKQETVKTVQPKKPKKIRAEKIEEKERESERRVKVDQRELTPAEIQAEKLLRQKLQEESDLRVAMETFASPENGSAESSAAAGIDAMNPSSKEEFDDLQEALSKKINSYNKSSHFPGFAEELIRNICANLTSYDLKKLKTTVENMFLEKTKQEKGDKAKKNKGKGKAKLKVEGETQTLEYYEYDDFDDFM